MNEATPPAPLSADPDVRAAFAYFGDTPFNLRLDEVHRDTGVLLENESAKIAAMVRASFTQTTVDVRGNHLFVASKFEGGRIAGPGGVNGHMIACTFDNVQFEGWFGGHFVDCKFNRCRFGPKVVLGESVRFIRVTGLESCVGLEAVVPRDNADLERDLADTKLAWWCCKPSTWAILRVVGSLPFFGLSYAGVPILLFLIAAVDLYNRRVTEMGMSLQRVGISWETGALLVSGICLMVASTIYALRCPTRIQEFSLARWTEEFGKSAVQYVPISWSRPLSRWTALVLYLIGGGLAVVVLGARLLTAVEQIARNIG